VKYINHTIRHFERFWLLHHRASQSARLRQIRPLPWTSATALIVCALILFGVLIARRLEYLIGIYAVLLTCAYLLRIPLKELIQRNLVLVLVFVVPLSLPAIFVAIAGGTPLDSWGIFSVHGIQSFLIISTRALCAISLVQLLIATMGVPEILRGLLQLRVPASVVSLFSTMWSYLHVIGREAHSMASSLRARTISPTGIRRAYAILGVQGSVLLQNCVHAAEATHRAMLARGFNGSYGILPKSQPVGARDVVAIVGAIMLGFLGYL